MENNRIGYPKHISTSERQGLHDARVDARLHAPDEPVQQKVKNHAAAEALYFMRYTFGPVHMTLRVTPAREAGVANHAWNIEEILD